MDWSGLAASRARRPDPVTTNAVYVEEEDNTVAARAPIYDPPQRSPEAPEMMAQLKESVKRKLDSARNLSTPDMLLPLAPQDEHFDSCTQSAPRSVVDTTAVMLQLREHEERMASILEKQSDVCPSQRSVVDTTTVMQQLKEHEERMESILEKQRQMVVADVARSLDKFTGDVARALDKRLSSAKATDCAPATQAAPVAAQAAPEAGHLPLPRAAAPTPVAAVTLSEPQLLGTRGVPKFLSQESLNLDVEASLRASKRDLEDQARQLKIKHAHETMGKWAAGIVRAEHWWSALEEPERKGCVNDLLCSHCFEALCTFAILVNAVYICWTTNRAIQPEHLGAAPNLFMKVSDAGFAIFYTIEMLLKFYVHRFYLFVCYDAAWNVFEVVLIIFAVIDIVLDNLVADHSATNMLFLRSLRLIKVLRLLRAFHMVKDLRLMLDCVIGCFGSLFWAIVMLTFFIGMFSLIFVQGCTGYLLSETLDENSEQGLYDTFGTVQRGMMTLFKAATGGVDWADPYAVIQPTGRFYSLTYIFFIVFFMISVWNIVTSLFIERALSLATPDMANMMYEQQKQDIEAAEELMNLMRKADKDKSGSISMAEFLDCYHEEDFRTFFHIRGIDIKDGALFFRLLATISGTEEVDLNSFVSGCMRLKGTASGLDAHLLRYQVMQLYRLCDEAFAQMACNTEMINSLVSSSQAVGLAV